jgi:hypothetical protein
MSLQIIATATAVLVVSLMTLDQVRLRGMTPFKWALAPLILALLIASIWIE